VPASADVASIKWDDLGAARQLFEAKGIARDTFDDYIKTLHATHAGRVRTGDLDHLVFYWLQSARFTSAPPIEPALSAKGLVERLKPQDRAAFLRADPRATTPVMPGPVRARLDALLRAIAKPSTDPRLSYFRELVTSVFPQAEQRRAGLTAEYLRVMRFLYEKEFIAQRSAEAPTAVAELYRTRGLSTDTAVEAGYLVYLGLGIARSLDPERRIRRVLIVGPGLDLAPRTGMLDLAAPQSYQPWAVIDAVLGLSLARASELEVVAADINPRVVAHLRRAAANPPSLTLVSEIHDTATVKLTPEYREYFGGLGKAAGQTRNDTGGGPGGHLRKQLQVSRDAARTLTAEPLDVVTERLDDGRFDLVIATNILPYFDDVELSLAMANIGAMLAPGGLFLHNEARPLLLELSRAAGFPLEHSRHAIIATVADAPAPLFDSVFVHRKRTDP
jgi:hypothetical protein